MSQSKAQKREVALTEAVEEYKERLLSAITRRIHDRAEAEDILQDVFEEFVEAYDWGQAIETLGAWLFRVAQNKILDRFRRRRMREEHRARASQETMADALASSADEGWTRTWLREEIIDALDLLPKEQREVFVKNELEGMSFKDIARETGVSINTLLSRKRYAVLFLREHLKEVYNALK